MVEKRMEFLKKTFCRLCCSPQKRSEGQKWIRLATLENELAENYEVQGFSSIYFFVDGEYVTYNGQRTKDAIVTWIKKKIGPDIYNITTTEDAERILTSESKVVLGFLESLVGPETEQLATASKLEDDLNFYQTTNPNVAKLFHIEDISKHSA
ncbi:Protein disulfide isomerase-like 1-4 [Capsicum baccatum]|uniref:Protein disulfide isomerase-like 1-4 n=1 Tax=Capsicum baccatum TaxID=33114 RepID=A0A2G2XQB5_CAPBA|nr:Protein disulfide isomerase-like 1-4 [Capsicum baccatum]